MQLLICCSQALARSGRCEADGAFGGDTEAIGFRGPNSRSLARGVIDGIGSPSGRLRSQDIHSFGSVSEVSRTMVRYLERRDLEFEAKMIEVLHRMIPK